MRSGYLLLLGLCLPAFSIAGAETRRLSENDIYFREALYHAFQGDYIEAISRLDIASGRLSRVEPNVDPLHFDVGNLKFSKGDFEASYRMYQRAKDALKAILGKSDNQLIRNETSYRLARIFMQEGDIKEALNAIEKIHGEVPENIREEELFLRAQIYMANGNSAGAVRLLQRLSDSGGYKGFAVYNLGVALINIGQEKQGLDQLDKAGQKSADDEIVLSLRDKANLALGYRWMDAKQPATAKKYLERVRLSGPFSNKALLGSGWADIALGGFENALAPWTVLADRDVSDPSVQESLLGVPYAYAKLDLPGKATLLYGKALEIFDKEMSRLDASISSVNEGKFLLMLSHEGIKHDENWITSLGTLPEGPETWFLFDLMLSDDFENALGNYLDLRDLSRKLGVLDKQLNSSYNSMNLADSRHRQGFDEQLRQLKKHVRDSIFSVNTLLSKQGSMLEAMATEDLKKRRKHLMENQSQARIGMMESYERAGKIKAQASGAK